MAFGDELPGGGRLGAGSRRRPSPTSTRSSTPRSARRASAQASSSSRSSAVSARSGARTSSLHGHALEREQPLERGLTRKALDEAAQLAEPGGALRGRLTHDRRDLTRKRRRQRRNRADGTVCHPVRDERLRPDEDVEAGQQVLLERLERRVRDLQPDDVRRRRRAAARARRARSHSPSSTANS